MGAVASNRGSGCEYYRGGRCYRTQGHWEREHGINSRDYPVVQACIIYIAVTFSVIMLISDLVYAFVDPRIKAQYK